MLGCVERLAELYRKKNSYGHLLPQTVPGSHDHASKQELHEAAWSIAQPLLTPDAKTTAKQKEYANLLGTDKACDKPCVVVAAAIQGRVDALFYDPRAELYGECDSTGDTIETTTDDTGTDFVDLAATETLRADLTVTMAAAKSGLYAFPAANFVGELVCGKIGLDSDLPAWRAIQRWVAERDFIVELFPERPPNAHKGTFGKVLICAGSRHYLGAALLAGKAAFRIGAGWVTTACRPTPSRDGPPTGPSPWCRWRR